MASPNVITRYDLEQIAARDLSTPDDDLRGAARDRRLLLIELERAREECAQLRARIAALETRRAREEALIWPMKGGGKP